MSDVVTLANSSAETYCEVALGELTFGDSLRSKGIVEDHVLVLAETDAKWPPILVWGGRHLVLDGRHRVEAARRLGHSHIVAESYQGAMEDGYLEALRRNTTHGLPLGLDDRRNAAGRLLRDHGEWSDRRIAALCGLSSKAVARVRRQQVDEHGPGGGTIVVDLNHRVGRDGKRRPVQSADLRQRIEQALQANPDSSLRAIAIAAGGASPETVRRVRTRWSSRPKTAALDVREPARTPESTWQQVHALMSTEEGTEFSRWFDKTNVNGDWHRYVWSIPIGMVYEIVDEARRRGACWTEFASLLESRVRP